MSECRCQTDGRNTDSQLTFPQAFQYLLMIFKHQIACLAPEAAVYGRAGRIPFQHLQLGRAGFITYHFPSSFHFIKSFKCRTVRHPVSPLPGKVTGMNKNSDAGLVLYQNMRTKSGYRNAPVQDWDAGMPITSASASMPGGHLCKTTYVDVGEHGEAPGADHGKHQAHKDPNPKT